MSQTSDNFHIFKDLLDQTPNGVFKWDVWKLKEKAKGVYLGQYTENLQMNIKGRMYIHKISLNIGN